jgi:poly(hydroxyalkanoate) granule-associated protein
MDKQTQKGTQVRLWELPQDVLQRGREMAGRGHDIWLAGLGAVATVEEQGSTLFEDLVKRGQKVEEGGRKQLSTVRGKVQARRSELQDSVQENVYEPVLGALRHFGVPSRTEMRDLTSKVNGLARRIDSLTAKLDQMAAGAPVGPVFYVVAREQGEGWAVRREGRESAISTHPTKDEAVEAGRALASASPRSRLSVYKKDGTIQDSFTFAG